LGYSEILKNNRKFIKSKKGQLQVYDIFKLLQKDGAVMTKLLHKMFLLNTYMELKSQPKAEC